MTSQETFIANSWPYPAFRSAELDAMFLDIWTEMHAALILRALN